MTQPTQQTDAKFSLVLLPRDAAKILEGILPFLDRIEKAEPELRAQAIEQLRGWLVQTAAAFRNSDPEPKQPKVAPCPDCEKRKKQPSPPPVATSTSRQIGRLLAGAVLRKIGA